MRRPLAWGLGIVAVAAVGAGLVVFAGGAFAGDDEPTTAAYLAAVHEVCASYSERLDRIPPPGDLSSPGAIVESLQQALPVLRKQERAVKQLSVPPELEAELARFFALTDRSLAELQEALDAALDRALYPMATALTRFGEVRNEAKAVARRIGFDC